VRPATGVTKSATFEWRELQELPRAAGVEPPGTPGSGGRRVSAAVTGSHQGHQRVADQPGTVETFPNTTVSVCEAALGAAGVIEERNDLGLS
jgi:hypothetical protein